MLSALRNLLLLVVAIASLACCTARDYDVISAGSSHTCIVTDPEGTIKCTGENTEYGQAPLEAAGKGKFIQVSSGMMHTCGLLDIDADAPESGMIRCWGKNHKEQAPAIKGSPTTPYKQVAAGAGGQTCAITSTDSIECWGSNFAGAATSAIPGSYIQVDAGTYHTCAVSNDKNLRCWGSNWFGQAPKAFGNGNIEQVSCGFHHSCVRYTNGTVECFGDNEANAVGTQAIGASQVTAGGHHTCAMLSTGLEVTCWGDNVYGQAPSTVVPANDGEKFKAISAGATHTCAYVVNAATGVYTNRQCWGFNVSE